MPMMTMKELAKCYKEYREKQIKNVDKAESKPAKKTTSKKATTKTTASKKSTAKKTTSKKK